MRNLLHHDGSTRRSSSVRTLRKYGQIKMFRTNIWYRIEIFHISMKKRKHKKCAIETKPQGSCACLVIRIASCARTHTLTERNCNDVQLSINWTHKITANRDDCDACKAEVYEFVRTSELLLELYDRPHVFMEKIWMHIIIMMIRVGRCANIFYGWNELTFSGQNWIEWEAGMGRVRSMLRSYIIFVLSACSSIFLPLNCHDLGPWTPPPPSRQFVRAKCQTKRMNNDELGIRTIVVSLRESKGTAKLFLISYRKWVFFSSFFLFFSALVDWRDRCDCLVGRVYYVSSILCCVVCPDVDMANGTTNVGSCFTFDAMMMAATAANAEINI